MRRSNRAERFESMREPAQARESLERRWRDQLTGEPRLATLVTAQGNAREPFHRWLPYRQGFSPGLVRLFLNEAGGIEGPVLDPFSGSGTTITECARQRREAIGVEAIPALAFLGVAKFEQSWHPLPMFGESDPWETIADRLELPLHRAALMIAHARRHTGSGALNRGAPSIAKSLTAVGDMIHEDLNYPLAMINESQCGDARDLDNIDDESVGGIITSPPYLSRYDYARTNDPVETVYRHWYGASACSPRESQVRATPRRHGAEESGGSIHRAAAEARDVLTGAGHRQQAQALVDYFTDMLAVLANAHRVLSANGLACFVIGGVRLKDVYVPTDLIVADMAYEAGFSVEGLRVARELNPIRRKFGSAGHLAPRESLIVLMKS